MNDFLKSNNVTRHRNGQSVKSRQTRWEWQLLISIMHIHDVHGDTLQQLPIPVCMCKYWSVHVVAKYKNRYENNTQYPFYTVAVKHETGELMTLTHTLAETKVQVIK